MEGPYEIKKVHRNGTVTMERGNYEQRIHIRRLKPSNKELHIKVSYDNNIEMYIDHGGVS
eukprot:7824094-Ditylum_brightwellii.AAC.1